MTTAQILYEQYRVLPPRIRQELKKMIVKEAPFAEEDEDDEDTDDRIHIAVEPLKAGLRELKQVLAGKAKAMPAREALRQLQAELDNEH